MATDSYPQSHGSLAGLSSTDHHPQYGMLLSGPFSARPGAPWRLGRVYVAMDTQMVSYDNGAGWVEQGNVYRVLYNTATSTYPARPVGSAYVEWVGPVTPPSAVSGDTWVNTTIP